MSWRFTILGSGSGGNCAYLETDTTRILVDAGFSGRQIEERLASIGRDPSQIQAILVTHEHGDHVQGLRVLAHRYRIPVYANRLTREAVLESFSQENGKNRACGFSWKIFEPGQPFVAGDFDIEPFTLPHDASDPVGFLVRHAGRCVVFLTDLGHTTQLVLEKARQADVLVIETNHDLKLLQNDPHRPWSVKQRIGGRHGHLSNEAAATVLQDVMSDRLRHVYLSHLSQDCNRPDLAEATVRKKLTEMGATHVKVTVTSQTTPCATERLESSRVGRPETASLFAQPVTP